MRIGESQASAPTSLPTDKKTAAPAQDAAPKVAGDRLSLSTARRAAPAASGGFSLGRALGHFGHGIVAQAQDMVKGAIAHPFMTLGALGLGAAAIAAAPLVGLTAATVGTAMTAGFGALAAWHVGKAGLTAIQDYRRGDTAKAEQDFEDIGRGTFDAAMAVGPAAAGKLAGALKGGRVATQAAEVAETSQATGAAKAAPAARPSAPPRLLPTKAASPRLGIAAVVEPKPLDAAAMRQVDAPIQAFGELNAEAREAMGTYYAGIYQDPELEARAHQLIRSWTSGGKGKEELRQAFVNVIQDGKAPTNEMEQTLADMAATRRVRWDRLAENLGIQTPERFHLYRGVRGDYAVEPLVKAWGDDVTGDMAIPHKEVASWSLNRETAEYFASGQEPSVIYEADVPFDQTILDKWSDGHALANLYSPQDEVVVAAPHDTLHVPEATATVTYKGKTYTYADRQALIQAWNEDHPQ